MRKFLIYLVISFYMICLSTTQEITMKSETKNTSHSKENLIKTKDKSKAANSTKSSTTENHIKASPSSTSKKTAYPH